MNKKEKVDPILHEKDSYYAYIIEDPNEPWPVKNVLRVGTNATAWIALSVVPIWYEIWRLMNAFPSKMVTPDTILSVEYDNKEYPASTGEFTDMSFYQTNR